MDRKTLFNIPIESVRRQILPKKTYDCDKDFPISTIKGETLEPCIKGAQKINKDSETKSIVKQVLICNHKK